MTCEFAFLAVGNADSIIVSPEDSPAIIVDIPKTRRVTDFLRERKKLSVGGIYITHAHSDHFAPVSAFVSFLEQWFDLGGSVEYIFLASEILYAACVELEELEKTHSKAFYQLHHALDRLYQWREGMVRFRPPTRDDRPSYQSGVLTIQVLHPEHFFAVRHSVKSHAGLNERSVVLKINYGDFSALLLADLEKAGLDDCLRICSKEELKAHLVKIPHHGAWPPNSSSLEELLTKTDAEIAILSVGSRNHYGHVVPQLFRLLNDLKGNGSLRLNKFLCTEVTRTCMLSSLQRTELGKAGLSERTPCAGDILIIAESTAKWTLETETNHPVVVSGIAYAACENRIDY